MVCSTALCQYPLVKVDLMLISAAIAPSLQGAHPHMDWDVKLAVEYKSLKRRLVSSILSSCYACRKLVEDELCKSMAKDDSGPC